MSKSNGETAESFTKHKGNYADVLISNSGHIAEFFFRKMAICLVICCETMVFQMITFKDNGNRADTNNK